MNPAALNNFITPIVRKKIIIDTDAEGNKVDDIILNGKSLMQTIAELTTTVEELKKLIKQKS